MASDDIFTFCNPGLVSGYLASFESMKEKEELCDVVFKVGNVSISAHRVILAAGIPYFKDLFMARDDETKSLEIGMAQTDPEALESLVNFAYSGKIEISKENMISLFSASAILGLHEIQEACCQFILERLSVENALKARKVAEYLNHGVLVERSEGYIAEHFGAFSQTEDFLTMPFSSLKKLIYDDYLSVKSEEEVFEAVMKWVEISDSQRHAVLPELLKGVRMTLLSPTYLFETISSNETIRASAACRDLLDEVKFHMLLPKKRNLFRSFSTSPRHSCKKIYVVCTTRLGCFVKFYNSERKKWSLLAATESQDYFLDVLVHNDNMYLFGGKIYGSLDLKTKKWKDLGPVHECVSGAGVVLHSDRIYIFGNNVRSLSRQVRCYDIFENNWQIDGFMIEYRSKPGVVCMRGSIYVVGGGYPDGLSRDSGVHNSVERYHLEERKSYSLPPMLVSRYWFGISALNDKIFVCGGCDSQRNSFGSAEVFDTRSNQWNFISSMNTASYCVSLVCCNKKLYAIGGKSNGRDTYKVEIYDPESNSWKFGDPVDFEYDLIPLQMIKPYEPTTWVRACTN